MEQLDYDNMAIRYFYEKTISINSERYKQYFSNQEIAYLYDCLNEMYNTKGEEQEFWESEFESDISNKQKKINSMN